jgi:hypothetical protein
VRSRRSSSSSEPSCRKPRRRLRSATK